MLFAMWQPGEENRKDRWQRFRYNIYFQVGFFFLAAFFEFAILELYFNISIFNYKADIILKNVLLFAGVNLFLTGLFHSIRLPLMISVVFFTMVGIANYFVVSFRGYGIVFMDFYAVKTAAEVAGGYGYDVGWDFITAFLCDIALFGACFLLPKRKHAYRHAKYMLISVLGMAASVLFFFWIDSDTVFFKDVSGLTWDHNIGMKDYGYVLYFTSNAGKAAVSEPAGYSAGRADEILSRFESVKKENNANAVSGNKDKDGLPNLIMVMNESFSDLSVLGEIKTDQKVMPFYNSLKKNVIKGFAESSVYGGYTANSEFEFLTGCTKAFLPGNPYLQYIEDYVPSLITNLKEQGYQEAVAVHPYHPSGYNRNRVYPLLGFDRFLSLEDFEKEAPVRDYVGDMENYLKIEELFEEKEPGSRLCLFNVTMQNHNPYDNVNYVFENPVHITNFSADITANQYLSLMKMSDDALEELISYFDGVEEPVMVVLFGDHQPHLKDSFYKTVTGSFPDVFSQEQVMKKHLVPFMIWANYDIEEQEIERISLNYLPTLVLKTAGLKMSNFDCYLSALQEKLPSISASGYYDREGVLHGYTEHGTEYQDLLEEYEIVQYNYLFGREKRLERHFSVSDG